MVLKSPTAPRLPRKAATEINGWLSHLRRLSVRSLTQPANTPPGNVKIESAIRGCLTPSEGFHPGHWPKAAWSNYQIQTFYQLHAAKNQKQIELNLHNPNDFPSFARPTRRRKGSCLPAKKPSKPLKTDLWKLRITYTIVPLRFNTLKLSCTRTAAERSAAAGMCHLHPMIQ